MSKDCCQFYIEVLLAYALEKGFLDKADVVFCRNQLLDLLQIAEPWAERPQGQPCKEAVLRAREMCPDHTPEPILTLILDDMMRRGLIEEDLVTYRDLMDAKIMGILTPAPSVVGRRFWAEQEEDPQLATQTFYNMSRDVHYVMTERIAKNLYWQAATPYGDMEITVNLSKPEKDPREIAKLKDVPSATYPACMICADNEGYVGRVNHPARQNHRIIPFTLQGEDWFLQYSPYVYYSEHCILLKGEHVPMKISPTTFRRLFDFIEALPHYFMGSNAGLPVVGGSILHHEHYQGGHHVFPMEKAEVLREYRMEGAPDVKISYIHWPLTTLRLSAAKRESVEAVADCILEAWERYSAPELGIYAVTTENGKEVPHNAITPIARFNQAGEYELDLALRNNITTAELPDGVFHPHPRYHHIKKENIRLIEVMGLAVLPGRLQKELGLIAELLCGRTAETLTVEERAALDKHQPWIEGLVAEHGTAMEPAAAEKLLQDQVGEIFSKVLECCGVFKQDEAGQKGLEEFLQSCGMRAC